MLLESRASWLQYSTFEDVLILGPHTFGTSFGTFAAPGERENSLCRARP